MQEQETSAPHAAEPTFELTVITVCRNVLQELQSTVESVLAQKRRGDLRIEHVVVDGASADGTPEWLAEALAAGKIDAYVSEPDGGIYDAMNKGIRMARGAVLNFMNAGDCFCAGADLCACVRPVAEGRYGSSVAATRYLTPDGTLHHRMAPDARRAYYDIIGCHQAYFFSTALCRECGGYDDGSFRSAADLALMNAVMQRSGLPLCLRAEVADFRMGGFSDNCWQSKRHEFIEIHHRAWVQLTARCRGDRHFMRLLVTLLAEHACTLNAYPAEQQPRVQQQRALLQEMCRTLPLPFSRLYFRPALLHLAAGPSALQQALSLLCAARYGNPYVASYQGRLRPWWPKAVVETLVKG